MSIYGDRLKQYKSLATNGQETLLFKILQAVDAVAEASGGGGGGGLATETKQDAIITALGSLALEVTADAINLNTDTLETSNDAIQAAVELIRDRTTPKNKLYRLENEAEDTVQTLTTADSQTSDERVTSIVYSSAALGISATKTIAYNASPPYYVTSITIT